MVFSYSIVQFFCETKFLCDIALLPNKILVFAQVEMQMKSNRDMLRQINFRVWKTQVFLSFSPKF